MEKVSIQTLLEAGAHFGHQTRRWNPKMKPYIFGSRGDIYIIDLKKSLEGMDAAYSFVSELVAKGGTILFVGTKKQAQESISEAANSCGMPYVNARWLGGMLTNFQTIRTRVQRMEELEAMDSDGRMAVLPKKEQILLRKELVRLQTNLNGIRNMKKVPDAVFIIDTNKEETAIKEAKRLGIPVVGTLDTNCDPDDVEYGIPANDDAIRTVKLLVDFVAHAVVTALGAPVTAAEMAGEAQAQEAAPAVEAAEVAEVAPAEEPVVEEAVETEEVPAEAEETPAVEDAPVEETVESEASVEEAVEEVAEAGEEAAEAVEEAAEATEEAAEDAIEEAGEEVVEDTTEDATE